MFFRRPQTQTPVTNNLPKFDVDIGNAAIIKYKVETGTEAAPEFGRFWNPIKKEILLKISYNSRGFLGLFCGVFRSQRDSRGRQVAMKDR